MSIFACPACGEELRWEEKTCRCPNGHSYDIASEGYVYLLPPNKKHSAQPGDCREMVAARRRFLEKGYYGIFSDALNRIALKYLPEKPTAAVLDAGCGEGYYTGRLRRFLTDSGRKAEVCGFDISKSAVRAAAKKYRDIRFCVGSIFEIPALDGCADLLTDMFAPIVPAELNRVLKPGGVLILAVPSERHLFGLKEILYDAPYENEHRETEYPGFRFLERVCVRGEIRTQDAGTMQDLFVMTPYCFKTPKEGVERLQKTPSLATETGFDFLIYRKEEIA